MGTWVSTPQKNFFCCCLWNTTFSRACLSVEVQIWEVEAYGPFWTQVYCLASLQPVYSAKSWFLNAYPVTLASFLIRSGRRCDSLSHPVAEKSLGISPVNLVAQWEIQWEKFLIFIWGIVFFKRGENLVLTDLNISRWQLARGSKMDSNKFTLIHTKEYFN